MLKYAKKEIEISAFRSVDLLAKILVDQQLGIQVLVILLIYTVERKNYASFTVFGIQLFHRIKFVGKKISSLLLFYE